MHFTFSINILSALVGALSLYLAGVIKGPFLGSTKVLVIAFLAEFATPLVLSYLSFVTPLIPFGTFGLRLLVWILLIKWVKGNVSFISATFLGSFAFFISSLIYFIF